MANRYIVIEGNIGAGKTTLCKHIHEQSDGVQLVLEAFDDNPFLPHFYEKPEQYGFQVELFFLTERHKQMNDAFAKRSLFEHFTLSDYFFPKTLLFAQKNLEGEEFKLFRRIFKALQGNFPRPDVLFFIYRPIPILLKNIAQRNRAYEQDIEATYLQKIQDAYFQYFKTIVDYPIVVIDAGDAELIHDADNYKKMEDLLARSFEKGLHFYHLNGAPSEEVLF